MSGHTVHFPCPQCGKRLEVDAGFRGAVARCDHCGALISVPTKSEAPGPAKARPARPGQPAPAANAAPGSIGAAERPARSVPWATILGVAVVALALAVAAWLLTR